MDDPNDFTLVVKLKLSELVEGVPTLTAATEAMNQYIADLRAVAVMPNNLKAREPLVKAADAKLIAELSKLADTEHDDKPEPKPAPAAQKRSGRH